MGPKMVTEFIIGLIILYIKASGNLMNSMETGNIPGVTEENMLDNGVII